MECKKDIRVLHPLYVEQEVLQLGVSYVQLKCLTLMM